MYAVPVLIDYLIAQLTNVRHGELIDDAWKAFAEPFVQMLFGTRDDRANFPQCVVEIQRDRANVVHVLLVKAE